jgi:hypothetical protein
LEPWRIVVGRRRPEKRLLCCRPATKCAPENT